MKLNYAVFCLASAALLASCAPKKIPLKGVRLDPRSVVGAGEAGPPPGDYAPHMVPVRLPTPRINTQWTERNGSPSHTIIQPALGLSLTPIWTAPIGRGDDKRHQITSDPVVANGRIFTLDSEATVTATTTAGKTAWQTDITPPGDRRGAVSGGGLAYGDGKLFVTSAFGELVAINPVNGQILWRQKFTAPATGAPTVSGNTVYVTTRNAAAYALNTADGRIRWTFDGVPSIASLTGGPAPAVSGRTVVFPFSSDEMTAALASGGTILWRAQVAGRRLGHVYADISDIAGDPVISGDTVYVGNATGRIGAYDLTTGEAKWTSPEGTLGPVWPAGGQLYFISDQMKLVRMNAETGKIVWKVQLPYFEPYRKEVRRRDIYVNFGPLLAGNRLIVPSSDGMFQVFDPASGALLAKKPIGAGATTNAVVANQTLYIVTEDGKLRAFR